MTDRVPTDVTMASRLSEMPALIQRLRSDSELLSRIRGREADFLIAMREALANAVTRGNQSDASKYRHDKTFSDPANRRQWFTDEDLFQTGADGVETLSVFGKQRIDEAATEFGDAMVSHPIVVEGYASASDHEEQFAKSRNRALLVSQYLRTHFHLDVQNVGALSLRASRLPG